MFVLLCWLILVLVTIRLPTLRWYRLFKATPLHTQILCTHSCSLSVSHSHFSISPHSHAHLHTPHTVTHFARSYAYPLGDSLFTHSYNTTPSSTLFFTATLPLGSMSRSESEGVSATHMKCSPRPLSDVCKEDRAEQRLSDLPETNSGADGRVRPTSVSHSIVVFFGLIYFATNLLFSGSKLFFLTSNFIPSTSRDFSQDSSRLKGSSFGFVLQERERLDCLFTLRIKYRHASSRNPDKNPAALPKVTVALSVFAFDTLPVD